MYGNWLENDDKGNTSLLPLFFHGSYTINEWEIAPHPLQNEKIHYQKDDGRWATVCMRNTGWTKIKRKKNEKSREKWIKNRKIRWGKKRSIRLINVELVVGAPMNNIQYYRIIIDHHKQIEELWPCCGYHRPPTTDRVSPLRPPLQPLFTLSTPHLFHLPSAPFPMHRVFPDFSFCRRRPLEGEGVAYRTTYTVLKTLATEKTEEEKKHNRSSTTNEDVYYVCTYPEIIKSHGWAIDPIRIDRY